MVAGEAPHGDPLTNIEQLFWPKGLVMARRRSILQTLVDDAPAAAEAPAPASAPEPAPGAAAEQGAAAPPSRARSGKRAASPAPPSSSGEAPARPRPEPPEVWIANSRECAKITLYLHPDDAAGLAAARRADAVDANARIRALLALWRTDPRLRNRVDRLARQTPRGNGETYPPLTDRAPAAGPRRVRRSEVGR